MREKLLIIIVFFTLLAATAYAVSLEYTTTLLYFNIGVARDIRVLIYNAGSWDSATSGGTPTSDNIEFNCTAQECVWVNATTVSGADTQDDSNPIIQIDNAGTVDAQVNISLNASMPSGTCTMKLRYENDTITYPPATSDLDTNNVTLIQDLKADDVYLDIWLFANFSGQCQTSDSDQRNLTIWADYAS